MLVLNTNEQGSSGNVLSNSMIRAYPDFRSLLFYPNIATYKNLYYDNINATGDDVFFSNASSVGAFTINGTKVDVENQTLLEDMLLIGGQNGQTLGNNLYIGGYGNYNIPSTVPNGKGTRVFRFGFSEILEGGEIIGKKITTNLGFCFDYNQRSATANKGKFILGIVYRVGLLHSDGSITYGDWIENDDYKAPNLGDVQSSGSLYFGKSCVNITNETNGLTAVAGDRVIFEIGSRITYTNNQGVGYISRNTNLYFGKRGTPNNIYITSNSRGSTNLNNSSYLQGDMRGRPIQISIE